MVVKLLKCYHFTKLTKFVSVPLRGNGRETLRASATLEGLKRVSVPLRGNGRETFIFDK